jgi:hypothetical protein
MSESIDPQMAKRKTQKLCRSPRALLAVENNLAAIALDFRELRPAPLLTARIGVKSITGSSSLAQVA